MQIPLHQIDAFADGPFTGNPAAVCPLDDWLADDLMQAIAAENNLSETAFFVRRGRRLPPALVHARRPRSICAAMRRSPRPSVILRFMAPDARPRRLPAPRRPAS